MIRRIRHTIASVLLASYLVVGMVGHWGELSRIFSFDIIPATITRAKESPVKDGRVYWTQQRHIPSSVRFEVPSAAVQELPTIRIDLEFIRYADVTPVFDLPGYPLVSISPRAPPIS